MQKLLFKIFCKFFPIEWFQEALQNLSIKKCINHCQAEATSIFYPEAKIHNLQNQKNNICIGKNTHIRGELLIFGYGGKIYIGDNCYIGENSRIWSANDIKIGNHVLISHNVNIIDTNSHEMDFNERAQTFEKIITEGHPKSPLNIKTAPIVIKNHAWISFNVCILKGVTIGEGAIISAGSVVTKDVAPFTIVAGNPAKFIKNIKS